MLCITTLILLARLAAGALDVDLQAKYLTMPRHEFIEYFNKQNYSYKITDYADDVHRKSGAHIDYNNIKDYPVKSNDFRSFENLPEKFDAREKWPECESIKKVYNQGSCYSCWTFGVADTASDRTCIHKNIHVLLAQQDFECQQHNACERGDPHAAIEFWLNEGLVTQECKPYNVTKLNGHVCKHECVNKDIDYAQDKHYAEQVYAIPSESADDIKAELFNNGPIQAAFTVFEDFLDYSEGVYEHKFGKALEGHSVRVIGYGIENGVQYWLVTNSWGAGWGENGHFKVKAFAEDVKFESYLFSGIPKS